MSTSANALVVKDKVQRWLNEAVGSLTVDRDGDFTFRYGSSRIFVRVVEQQDPDRLLVVMEMPLLLEVPLTPELYEYVATENGYYFGKLVVVVRDGVGTVVFGHTLLGDYLDAEELHTGVGALVNVGDRLDNEMQEKFGGKRFHEDE